MNARCARIALLIAVCVCAGCGPEPVEWFDLAAGIRLAPVSGWDFAAHEAGGFEVSTRAAVRIRKAHFMAQPLSGDASDPAWISRVTGLELAGTFRDRLLATNSLQGLYTSYFAGFVYDAFEVIEADGKRWGIITLRRRGRKTTYWSTLFTAHRGSSLVLAAFYDEVDGKAAPLGEWVDYLSMLSFVE